MPHVNKIITEYCKEMGRIPREIGEAKTARTLPI